MVEALAQPRGEVGANSTCVCAMQMHKRKPRQARSTGSTATSLAASESSWTLLRMSSRNPMIAVCMLRFKAVGAAEVFAMTLAMIPTKTATVLAFVAVGGAALHAPLCEEWLLCAGCIHTRSR
eukprot:5853042-Amphidinium_carterae.2